MSKHTVKPLTDKEFEALKKKHDIEGGNIAQAGARQAQGCWDSGIKIIQNCGHMNTPEYLIRFSQIAHEKIECLKRSYPSLEWLAYLEGRVDHEAHEVFVDDLIIPESQVVTSGHVGEVEYGWDEGKEICGVIHSHNTMGAFFSGTDDAYINQNHDVSVCVSTSRGREICAQVRTKTPCGSYLINEKIRFKIDYTTTLNEKEFVAMFTPRIRTPRVLFQRRPAMVRGKGVQGANSARGGQSNISDGVRPELQSTGPAEDPFKMDEATVRGELLKFHTEDDIADMERCQLCLATELEACYDALGLVVDCGQPNFTFKEDEEDVEDVYLENGWDTAEPEPASKIKVIQ